VHRSWQKRTALLTWSALSFCFRSSRSLPLTVFFMDEKMFSVASPDNRQNKVSGRLQELLKKRLSVFFSVVTVQSVAAWPPVNCACVQQLFEQLIYTRLCPAFLRKIRLSTSLLCSPSNTNFFYQNLVFIAEYHVGCWQTLQWRLLWQIFGATNWSQK